MRVLCAHVNGLALTANRGEGGCFFREWRPFGCSGTWLIFWRKCMGMDVRSICRSGLVFRWRASPRVGRRINVTSFFEIGQEKLTGRGISSRGSGIRAEGLMDPFHGHAAFADGGGGGAALDCPGADITGGEYAGAGMESTVRPRGRPRKLVAKDQRCL